MSEDLEIPTSMWFSVCLVATQSFLFGYVFAGLNSCLVVGSGNDGSACFNNEPESDCPPGTMYNDINLTTLDTQIATSLVIIGAWIGCLVSSYPSEKYGRRTTILYNNLFFIIGATLSSLGNLNSLFIGRFISGFGVGVESMLAPVLLAEIAHPSSRGKITTMHQVCLTFAIFFVAILSYIFVSYVDHGWQYVQLGSAVPSIIMLIFASYVPESPKWLLIQGLKKEAENTMIQLRPIGYNSKDEIDLIEAESLNNSKLETTWTDVFAFKNAMIIGCGLLLFQVYIIFFIYFKKMYYYIY
jgi:MFS family permease